MSARSERAAFEAILKEDPYDAAAHRVYADWLEEHGFDDESAWQRSWTPERQRSEEWLREFAKKCGSTCINYAKWTKEGKKRYDEWGKKPYSQRGPYPENTHEKEKWKKITYEDVIQAGRDFVESGGNEWFTQMGSEKARDLMWEDGVAEKFWDCWSLVTGIPVTGEVRESGPFSCSC